MTTKLHPNRRGALALAAAVALSALALPCFDAVAEAQTPVAVESSVQGTVGLGLIGAELGLVLPALFDMDGVWPYLVFPVALGAGGGVGGYFLLDEPNHVDAGVAVLATGIALIIPSVVAALALTAYDPEDDAVLQGSKPKQAGSKKDFGDDGADAVDEGADEAAPAAEPVAPAEPPVAAPPEGGAAPGGTPFAGLGLVRVGGTGAVQFAVPLPSVVGAYSLAERRQMHVRQVSELRVPLLTGSF